MAFSLQKVSQEFEKKLVQILGENNFGKFWNRRSQNEKIISVFMRGVYDLRGFWL